MYGMISSWISCSIPTAVRRHWFENMVIETKGAHERLKHVSADLLVEHRNILRALRSTEENCIIADAADLSDITMPIEFAFKVDVFHWVGLKVWVTPAFFLIPKRNVDSFR